MKAIVMTIGFLVPVSAFSESVRLTEAQTAHVTMQAEINAEVEQYARKLGVSSDFVSYCVTELSLKTDQLPTDGLIPYGVDYRSPPDKDSLDTIIAIARAHRRSFLFLCIANVKNTLSAAEHH